MRVVKDGAISYLEAKINGTWTRINGLVQKIGTDVDDATDRANASAVPNTAAVYTKTQALSARIDALQGSYIYRGALPEGTAATQQNLTVFIVTTYTRQPQLGDVVVDNDGSEWYFNGSLWADMGAPDQNKMDKLTGASIADKILTSDANGQAQASAKVFGGATFNATPNQATIPNESSVKTFVEGKNYLPKSGGRLTGWVQNPSSDLSVTVGTDGDFQTIGSAISYIKRVNPSYAIIHLLSGHIDPGGFSVSIGGMVAITGPSDDDRATINGSFSVIGNSYLSLQYLNIYSGVNANASSYIYIRDCQISSSESGNPALGIYGNSYCVTTNTTFSSTYGQAVIVRFNSMLRTQTGTVIQDSPTAMYANEGSVITAQNNYCTVINCTNVSSPAINTVGNANSYIVR